MPDTEETPEERAAREAGTRRRAEGMRRHTIRGDAEETATRALVDAIGSATLIARRAPGEPRNRTRTVIGAALRKLKTEKPGKFRGLMVAVRAMKITARLNGPGRKAWKKTILKPTRDGIGVPRASY